jgi:hypothetical protein
LLAFVNLIGGFDCEIFHGRPLLKRLFKFACALAEYLLEIGNRFARSRSLASLGSDRITTR